METGETKQWRRKIICRHAPSQKSQYSIGLTESSVQYNKVIPSRPIKSGGCILPAKRIRAHVVWENAWKRARVWLSQNACRDSVERACALRFLAKWSRFVREIRGKCTFPGTGASENAERAADGMSEYEGGRVSLRVEMRELGSVWPATESIISPAGANPSLFTATPQARLTLARGMKTYFACARVCVREREASHK